MPINKQPVRVNKQQITRLRPFGDVAVELASLAAVKLDADLKAYYKRKVGEGKSKLSVLNAVKNKLLARVIAVVNKQELYVKKVA